MGAGIGLIGMLNNTNVGPGSKNSLFFLTSHRKLQSDGSIGWHRKVGQSVPRNVVGLK